MLDRLNPRQRLDRLTKRHMLLVNREPTEEQLMLYTAFPEKRGFKQGVGLTEEQEAKMFEASFLLAFGQAFVEGKTKYPTPVVYLLIPERLRQWADEQVKGIARHIFTICREQKSVEKAQHLGQLLNRLYLVDRVVPSTVCPDRWAAYGYGESDTGLPDWLSGALMEIPPFMRADT